jgi:hypothetical protein
VARPPPRRCRAASRATSTTCRPRHTYDTRLQSPHTRTHTRTHAPPIYTHSLSRSHTHTPLYTYTHLHFSLPFPLPFPLPCLCPNSSPPFSHQRWGLCSPGRRRRSWVRSEEDLALLTKLTLTLAPEEAVPHMCYVSTRQRATSPDAPALQDGGTYLHPSVMKYKRWDQ